MAGEYKLPYTGPQIKTKLDKIEELSQSMEDIPSVYETKDNVNLKIENVNNSISAKADKAITLAGYGIADGATKTDLNALATNLSNYNLELSQHISNPLHISETPPEVGNVWIDTSNEDGGGNIDLSNYVTINTFNTEINSLKTSVSEGKALIAAAVTDKGVETATDASFATMASNIESISVVNSGTLVNAQVASGYSVDINDWVSMISSSGETKGTINTYRYRSQAILGLSGNRFLELYSYKSDAGYAPSIYAQVWEIIGTSVIIQGTAIEVHKRSENILDIIRLQDSDDFIMMVGGQSKGYTGIYIYKLSISSNGTITKTQITHESNPYASNSCGGGICRIPNSKEYICYGEQGHSSDGYIRLFARYNNTTPIYNIDPSTANLPNGTFIYGAAYYTGYVYLFSSKICYKFNANSGAYISNFEFEPVYEGLYFISGKARVIDCENGIAILVKLDGNTLLWYKYDLTLETMVSSGSIVMPFDESVGSGTILYCVEHRGEYAYLAVSSQIGATCILKVSSSGVGIFDTYTNYDNTKTYSSCGFFNNMVMTSHYVEESSYYQPYYFIYNNGVLPYNGSNLYGISKTGGDEGDTIQVLIP